MPESETLAELRSTPRDQPRRRYTLSLLAALSAHAALLFAWKSGAFQAAEFGMQGEGGSMEVELVAGAEPASSDNAAPPPAEETPTPEPSPITPPEPPPPAEPEQAPEPEPQEEEMSPPEPKPEQPPPKPKPPQPERPKPVQSTRPTAPAKNANAASSSAANTGTSPGAFGRPGTGSGTGAGAGRGSTKPSYLSNPRPPYPPESKSKREQGVVFVRVSVGTDGRVTSATLQRSSGFPRLDTAAIEAVRRWRFRPATAAGVPVSDTVNVPVRFNLAD